GPTPISMLRSTCQCLARCATLGAGFAPEHPSSQARINMNRPLSHLATRAAYGASQLPRIAWYLGHGFAMTRIVQRAREREGGSPRPRPHTDSLDSHVNVVPADCNGSGIPLTAHR